MRPVLFESYSNPCTGGIDEAAGAGDGEGAAGLPAGAADGTGTAALAFSADCVGARLDCLTDRLREPLELWRIPHECAIDGPAVKPTTAPATAPTGPSTTAPDSAPRAASPARSWAFAIEGTRARAATSGAIFLMMLLTSTL